MSFKSGVTNIGKKSKVALYVALFDCVDGLHFTLF